MVKKSNCLWFDKRILVLLIVCYIQNVTSFWEYAICTKENIRLYENSSNFSSPKLLIKRKDLKQIKSITFDAKNDVFYFVNNENSNSGIFKLKVKSDWTYEISEVTQEKLKDDVRDLVFDPLENFLYWSDGKNGEIKRMKAEGKGAVEMFLDVTDDVEGIEIDSCTRKLFFVKMHSEKLNFVSLNATKAELKATEISVGNHEMPVAIAIDHQTRRIYVADVQGSAHYSIDSVLNDGSDFRREVDKSYRHPRSLAVDNEFVYYVDGSEHELRRFSKKYNGTAKESEFLTKFVFDPQDIIVRGSFVTDSESDICKKKVEKVEEVTPKVTTIAAAQPTTETCACQKTCQIDRCADFCLNDGKCSIFKDSPKCSCDSRFAGKRCEVDLCTNFCFNGECSVDGTLKQPKCKCKANFTGERCEKSTENVPETAEKFEECPQNSINVTHIIVAVCVALSLLVFLVILLVLKKMQRPLRPRVRKTFKVHKNIEPLTYRPHTEHCEVVIEDCCNMNICETPCYDPKVLQKEINESNLSVKLMPSSRCSSKDDKQDLLKHMEYNQ